MIITDFFWRLKLKPVVTHVLPFLFVLSVVSACTETGKDLEYYNRAETAFSAGRLNEAAQLYELFLDNETESPERFIAWKRLLTIYHDIGRNTEKGLNILRAMSVEYENDREKLWFIYMKIGRLYAGQNKFESSIDFYERTLDMAESGQELFQSYEALAEVHYKKRDYSTAARLLREFLSSDESKLPARTGRINYLLGRAYYQLKDSDSAVEHLVRTLYMDAPENQRSKAGMLLYDIYLEMKDFENARKVLEELEKFYPNPKVIRIRLDDLP